MLRFTPHYDVRKRLSYCYVHNEAKIVIMKYYKISNFVLVKNHVTTSTICL